MPATATKPAAAPNGSEWLAQEEQIEADLREARQRARRLDVDQEEAEREVARLENLLAALRSRREDGRASTAWRLRAQGATYAEIADLLPRYDGSGGMGVSKPRVQQILMQEADRRFAEARSAEEIQRIQDQARMPALSSRVEEALARVAGA